MKNCVAGLSELTFDPRPDIRKSALEVLFDTLRFHGHMFSSGLWERVFDKVLFPIFDHVRRATEPAALRQEQEGGPPKEQAELEMDAWLYETCTLALQLVVDLFVKFYPVVCTLLGKILQLLTGFIKRPHQNLAGIGVAAFVRLMSNAGSLFTEENWLEALTALKDAAVETLPDLGRILGPSFVQGKTAAGSIEKGSGELVSTQSALPLLIADAKSKVSVQMLIVQVMLRNGRCY